MSLLDKPLSRTRHILRDRFRTFVPLLPSLMLCILLALVFAIRLRFMTVGGYFSSDGKNYLVTMQQVFGNDFTGHGLNRPPMIALPLKLATIVWGLITGSRILSVLVTVLIGWPFYLLMRRCMSPAIAVLGSVFFVLNPMYPEMLCWGYITFFGIFFSLFAFYFILKSLDDPSRRNILLAGLMASLVVGFHQTSFIIFLLCTGALFVLLCATDTRHIRQTATRFLWIGLAGAVLALPYVPSYISQARNISGEYVGAIFQIRNAGQIASRFQYFFGRHVQVWILTCLPILVGLITLRRRDRRFFLLVVATLLVPLALNMLDSADLADRSAYFMYFPVWALFCAGLVWLYEQSSRLGKSRLAHRGAVAARVVIVIALAYIGTNLLNTSQAQLQESSKFYNTMDNAEIKTAEWIKAANLPVSANMAVHPSSFADWIEAVAAHQAFNSVIPIRGAWKEQTNQAQATIALFSGSQSIDNGDLRISTTYPYLQSDGLLFAPYVPFMGSGRTAVEALILAENGATLEYDTAQGRKTVVLAQATSTDFEVTRTVDGICMHTTYIFTDLQLDRTVCLREGQRSASVEYQFDAQEGMITFRMPIEMVAARRQLEISDGKVAVKEQRAFGSAEYQVTTKGSGILSQQISRQQGSDASLSCEFEMTGTRPSVQFEIDIQVPGSIAGGVLNHFSTPDLLQEYSIRYLAMDKTPPLFADRDALSPYTLSWLDTAPYYFPIYENNNITVYRVRPYYDTGPQYPLTASVEGGIRLIGWTSPGDTIKVEDGLDLLLFWQADRQTSEDYKVFVHLLDQGGAIVAQYDSKPCRWQCPTFLWQVGQTIIDKRTIPIPTDLAPGEYTLVTGMYIDKTGERLKATNREGQEWPSDEIVLGKISVVR